MKTIFELEIVPDEILNFKDKAVTMILFHGECKGDYLTGKILPGGVDTQRSLEDGSRSLSARYMICGIDYKGQECHLFIENNGIDSGKGLVTKPEIRTDSDALKFLENENLEGSIQPGKEEGSIRIIICCK